jgi:hypothetical protein
VETTVVGVELVVVLDVEVLVDDEEDVVEPVPGMLQPSDWSSGKSEA